MTSITDILHLAKERALQLKLAYQGTMTPQEAFEVLEHAPDAKLVDVRTRAELDWVGRIPGAVEIEWNMYPGNQPNPHFLNQLKQQVAPASTVMFICRSGARSHAAAIAASESGYPDCYNVLEGFEGEKDANGQRGKVSGWRHAGLPWMQS
ncbi:MAG TPA: rhodanese-like domain-containing protein [Rhodocyclaceae bacterium]|nr:rhodanese-like domain-containing protein [Rhodocyclaceae bacterium]